MRPLQIKQSTVPALRMDSSSRLIGNNIIRWTNPQNGASILPDWNGEQTIAVLGYDYGDYGGGTFAGAKTCDIEVLQNIGPTVPGLCSASRMTWQGAPTANQYLPNATKTTPPAGLLNFFNDGNSIGDNQQKPSDFHILLAVWFEYEFTVSRPFPYPATPASVWYIGTGATSIGTGDVMEMTLPNGFTQTYFTDWNQFQISTPTPPPKGLVETTDWSDSNPHVTWIIVPVNDAPQFTVRIVGPQYLQGSPDPDKNKAYFYAPPQNMKYYVHAQGVYGCGGIVPGSVNASAPVVGVPQPQTASIDKFFQRSHP